MEIRQETIYLTSVNFNVFIAMPCRSPAVRLEYLIVVYLRPMRMKARESALVDFLPNWAGAERKNVCTVKKV
jgi:hypothetical protein